MLGLEIQAHNPHTPVIDLHEFHNQYEALEFLEHELYRLYKNHESHVRVIHGIGGGILKNKVHEALKSNPLITEFMPEKSGGSTIVLLNT